MKFTVHAVALAAGILFAGCGTQYQDAEYSDAGHGWYLQEVTPQLTRIRFRSPFKSAAVKSGYTIYRAAEYAKSKGKSWFLVYENMPDAMNNKVAKMEHLEARGRLEAMIYVRLLDKEDPRALRVEDVLSRPVE